MENPDMPGSTYSFAFNDVMGLEGDHGVCTSDIINAMKGHIKEGYKFNPSSPLSQDDSYWYVSPSLEDQVHCLVTVVEVNKIAIMNDDTARKLREIRLAANDLAESELLAQQGANVTADVAAARTRQITAKRCLDVPSRGRVVSTPQPLLAIQLKNRFLPLLREPERSQTTQLALHLNQHRAARTERDAAEDNNTQGRDRTHSDRVTAAASCRPQSQPLILITGDVTINSIHAYEAVEDKAYLPPDLAASPDDVQNPDIQTSAPISQEKHTMCSPPDIQSSSPSASPSASLAAPPTQPSDERDSVCHVRPSPSSTPHPLAGTAASRLGVPRPASTILHPPVRPCPWCSGLRLA
ncbi:hypothetical protein AAFF_G00338440 [Aldrovandia affinis]|uniref:Uncharacterized protein n=1 Tax=Aldrovandia affinis TaxID=143900 RepID=A0AAD7VZY5_9TELE|nr:hypothetical protein AAFF_G00338440 [Aldrovandia affinis]